MTYGLSASQHWPSELSQGRGQWVERRSAAVNGKSRLDHLTYVIHNRDRVLLLGNINPAEEHLVCFSLKSRK